MRIIVLHFLSRPKQRYWMLHIVGKVRQGGCRCFAVVISFSCFLTLTSILLNISVFKTRSFRVETVKYMNRSRCQQNRAWTDVFQCRQNFVRENGTRRTLWSQGYKNPCFRNKRKHAQDKSPELLQCVPYFFVVGFPKCGTTDLFDRMSYHPEFIPPSFKEIHWISRYRFVPPRRKDRLQFLAMNKTYRTKDFDYGFLQYTRVFYPMVLDIEIEKNKANREDIDYHRVTGDFSPSTIWDNDMYSILSRNKNLEIPEYITADFVKEMNPCAKLIVMFRDPVQRLYSDYLFFPGLNKGPEDFHNKVTSSIMMFNDCVDKRSVEACVFDATLARISAVRLRLGMYVYFVEKWLKRFPVDQFLFLRLEDYATDTAYILDTIFNFLQMSQVDDTTMRRMEILNATNTRKAGAPEMLTQTLNILTDFYEPFNTKLSDLLKDKKYLYHLLS